MKVLATGDWLRLVSDDGWEYAERIGSQGVVVIAALTDDDEIVLVEQYRPAVHARVIEPPAGLIGDGENSADEDPALAARRELLEETGFEAGELELVAQCPASAGALSETFSYFRARDLRRTGPGGGDETEDITVHVVPRREVMHFLREQRKAGVLADAKVFASLYLLDVEL